jgi:ubiquinone/menaquinone biosynthesis C-methylase UbiE
MTYRSLGKSFAWLGLCGIMLLYTAPAAAQRLTPDSTLGSGSTTEAETIPSAQTHYLGRRIADTMHHTGAPWLTRGSREEEERCSMMLTNLGVKPGMTVCDMGCGNGYYSLQLAKLVGSKGRVWAVDVQPEMLKLLREQIRLAGAENVTPILGQVHDPKLPPGEVDIFLLVDVYHEFSHPQQMLTAMRRSLAKNGVVVLVEYREEDPKVPIKPLHKMSRNQVLKELQANGFRLVKQYDGLPWQHMLSFGRDDAQRASE